VFEVPRLVRTSYAVRTAALAYAFVAIGVHLWERDSGLAVWIGCALQFLAYPHLPMRAEHGKLYIDSALLGAWIAFLGFPSWIALGLLGATLLNATVNRGLPGTLVALGCSTAGAALALAVFGFRYRPDTSGLVTALCFFGILGYTCGFGQVVHGQNRRIARAREKLPASDRSVPQDVTEAIVITGADGIVQTVNQAFCEITGYSRDEVVGRPEKALRNGAQPPEFYDDLYATVQREGRWSGTQRGARKDGSAYREWRSVLAVRDALGATTHYVIVFFDAGAA